MDGWINRWMDKQMDECTKELLSGIDLWRGG